MPRHKKDPSVRARRNKAPTRATLTRVPTRADGGADYAAMTVAQLRDEIERRNGDGRRDPIKARGRKADLVAVLVADDSPVPAMPAGPQWHPQTEAWWEDVWSSPMSDQWDDSDVHNLYLLALLYNDMWVADTAKARKEAASEFRLQRADLGLSPYSRRRLEWTIETAAEAQDRGKQRRSRRSQDTGDAPAGQQGKTGTSPEAPADPRAALYSVS